MVCLKQGADLDLDLGLNLGLRVGYNFQEKKTPKTPVTVIQIDKQ